MVNIPRIKTKKNSVWYSTRKNRRACGVSLWSEHKTKSLLGWRQLPRSRNSNREVWESPYLQVGVDVKGKGFFLKVRAIALSNVRSPLLLH